MDHVTEPNTNSSLNKYAARCDFSFSSLIIDHVTVRVKPFVLMFMLYAGEMNSFFHSLVFHVVCFAEYIITCVAMSFIKNITEQKYLLSFDVGCFW